MLYHTGDQWTAMDNVARPEEVSELRELTTAGATGACIEFVAQRTSGGQEFNAPAQ